MIERIFAAPKGFENPAEGVAFAVENGLSYEIPDFTDPRVLIQSEQRLLELAPQLEQIPGWTVLDWPLPGLCPISPDPEIALLSGHRVLRMIEIAKSLKDAVFADFHRIPSRAGGLWVRRRTG